MTWAANNNRQAEEASMAFVDGCGEISKLGGERSQGTRATDWVVGIQSEGVAELLLCFDLRGVEQGWGLAPREHS